MASPDTRQYVDLTIFNEDPTVVLNEMLTAGRTLLPDWTPAVGQIETVLAEAIAFRSAELAAGINRLPDSTTEVLLQLFGLVRDDGLRRRLLLILSSMLLGRFLLEQKFCMLIP